MGFFTSIQRAWITIDNQFFIWNYLDNSDVTEYSELDQIITSCALVKPKSGIFKEQIQYLLVLSTAVEVVLIAVTLENNEINLLPTNYSISTDNITMLKIIGTREGRIFLCGQDGCLYELVYEASDTLFRKKCRKLNHSQSFIGTLIPSFLKWKSDSPLHHMCYDSHHNLLYTLSQNYMIEVYDLNTTTKCISYTQLREDVKRLQSLSHFDEYNLVNLFVMNQSSQVSLIAMSNKGDLFFFVNQNNTTLVLLSIKWNKNDLSVISNSATTTTNTNLLSSSFQQQQQMSTQQYKSRDALFIHEVYFYDQNGFMAMTQFEKESLLSFALEYNSHPKQYQMIKCEIELSSKPSAITQHDSLQYLCFCSNTIVWILKWRMIDRLCHSLLSKQMQWITKYDYDLILSLCLEIACHGLDEYSYKVIGGMDTNRTKYCQEEAIKRLQEAYYSSCSLQQSQPSLLSSLQQQQSQLYPTTMGMIQAITIPDTTSTTTTSNTLSTPPITISLQSPFYKACFVHLSQLLSVIWNQKIINNNNNTFIWMTTSHTILLSLLTKCKQFQSFLKDYSYLIELDRILAKCIDVLLCFYELHKLFEKIDYASIIMNPNQLLKERTVKDLILVQQSPHHQEEWNQFMEYIIEVYPEQEYLNQMIHNLSFMNNIFSIQQLYIMNGNYRLKRAKLAYEKSQYKEFKSEIQLSLKSFLKCSEWIYETVCKKYYAMQCYKEAIELAMEASKSLTRKQLDPIPCYQLISNMLFDMQQQQQLLFVFTVEKYDQTNPVLVNYLFKKAMELSKFNLLLAVSCKHSVEQFLLKEQYPSHLFLFYEKNQMNHKASQIAYQLAMDHNNEYTLQERIQYLSRALLLSVPSSSSMHNEIKNRIELARIQSMFVQKYQIQEWNRRVLDSKELIQFAKEKQYYDLYLLVLYYMDKSGILPVHNNTMVLQQLIYKAYRGIIIISQQNEQMIVNQLLELERELCKSSLFYPLREIMKLAMERKWNTMTWNQFMNHSIVLPEQWIQAMMMVEEREEEEWYVRVYQWLERATEMGNEKKEWYKKLHEQLKVIHPTHPLLQEMVIHL